MHVALRVDASATIGLGHLQRCLALAQALRALAVDVVFVTRELGLDSAERIAAAGFGVHRLAAPAAPMPAVDGPAHAAWAGVTAAQDAADTLAALRGGAAAPDWLVVDHYAFDARWHAALGSGLGARIAVIDDLADRPLQAELLVDPNLAEPYHRHKYAGRLDPRTPLLGGPRHALLLPAYADAPRCALHDTVRSIGIFLGGTDPAGLSATALRACRERAGFDGPIELVSTRANPRLDTLRALVQRWPRTTLSLDLPDLAAFFARHDLQIGAGGGATWERCLIGAPTLALVGAANQLAVVPQLARLGAVAALAPGQAASIEGIGDAVAALLADAPRRHALGACARTLVDGHGARRVALRLAADTLRVRRAGSDDSAMLHRWRNHTATRAVSHDSAPIPWPVHQRWLERVLADPRRLLLVGEVGGHAVGVIRFDRRDDGAAEVSLYLDPALHGLGLGSALLRRGEDAAQAWAGTPLPFAAGVLDGNAGSRRLFEAAGYRFDGLHGAKPAPFAPAAARLSLERPAP